MPLILEILEDLQTNKKLAIEETVNLNTIISSLEVLMVLLNDTQAYCFHKRNIAKCVNCICALAMEHQDNEMVTMPIIGTMLTLRDKNL